MVLCLVVPASAAAVGSDKAYWHEKRAASSDPYYLDWMKDIPDDTPLSRMSIPGSHDTMTYQGLGFELQLVRGVAQTQTMTLQQQLASGIRFVDIRLAHMGDHFAIYHGLAYLKSNFDNVLTTIRDFLAAHPTEFVFMRLLQEHSSVSDAEMGELLQVYYERYADLFYKGDHPNDPTMGELRGKVLINADRFTLPDNIINLYTYYTGNDNLFVQDYYKVSSNWDLYTKWDKVKDFLVKAGNDNAGNIYINWLNSSTGSFPYFVASGKCGPGTDYAQLATGIVYIGSSDKYPDFPRVKLGCNLYGINFMGINQLTTDYIRNNGYQKCSIVPADFPGEALIRSVIDCNFR